MKSVYIRFLAGILCGIVLLLCACENAPFPPEDTAAQHADTSDTADTSDVAEVPDTEPADPRPENLLCFYVTSGVQDGDGTEAHPFGTLEEARDAVRAAERTDDLTGICVYVSGMFERTATLDLTDPADSGSALCPVRWIGQDAVLSGAISFSVGECVPADDATSQYFPEGARDKIVSLDLKSYGIRPEDVAYSEVSPYKNGNKETMRARLNSVFCGDTRLTIARYPNEGKQAFTGKTEDLGEGNYRIKYTAIHKEHTDKWHDPDHVYLAGYFTYFCRYQYTRLTAFDAEEPIMTLPIIDYAPASGMPFFWMNMPEELDVPGEYYISDDAVFYYYPLSGEDRLTYPRLEEGLVNAKGSYLSFEGFTFEDAQGWLLELEGDHNTVCGCLFRRAGSVALHMSGEQNTLRDSEFAHIALCAAMLEGGDSDTLTGSGTVCVNNRIHDYAEASYCLTGALSVSGCGITVSHNEISDGITAVAFVSGNNHLFEYNYFHDVCWNLDDAGAIYSGRTLAWYGNVYRYNYFKNIGPEQKLEGSNVGNLVGGLYWDDGLGGQTAIGNIFDHVSGGGMYVGGGPDHVIRDNLFLVAEENDTSIKYDQRFYRPDTGHNLLQAIEDNCRKNKVYTEAFPTIAQMTYEFGDPWYWGNPARSEVTGNVVFYAKNDEDSYEISDQVKVASHVENNQTIQVSSNSTLPDVRDALEKSGLDIPFDEIGCYPAE